MSETNIDSDSEPSRSPLILTSRDKSPLVLHGERGIQYHVMGTRLREGGRISVSNMSPEKRRNSPMHTPVGREPFRIFLAYGEIRSSLIVTKVEPTANDNFLVTTEKQSDDGKGGVQPFGVFALRNVVPWKPEQPKTAESVAQVREGIAAKIWRKIRGV